MSLIKRYIIVLANLYGMVHKDKVIEIYNSQNNENISKIIINKKTISINDTTIKIDDLNRKFVYLYNDYFAHESILEFDDPESLLAHKKGKPHYIPAKNKLLKYEDDLYFEMTIEYKNLLKYFKNNIVQGDDELANSVCDDIQLHAQYGDSFSEIFSLFERRKIIFKDEKQAQEVVSLISILMNNTRIWENNGYTPNELAKLLDKPHLKPLPNEKFDFQKLSRKNSSTFVNEDKTGRNAPCPCGSGKKYKKCCLNTESILH